jgi:hypothetical protein
MLTSWSQPGIESVLPDSTASSTFSSVVEFLSVYYDCSSLRTGSGCFLIRNGVQGIAESPLSDIKRDSAPLVWRF